MFFHCLESSIDEPEQYMNNKLLHIKGIVFVKIFSQYFDHIDISLKAESVFVGVTLFT